MVVTDAGSDTISRFACHIICQRSPPYTARLYAAGFDSNKNIFLGVGDEMMDEMVCVCVCVCASVTA